MQSRVGETSSDEGLWEREPAGLDLAAALPLQMQDQGTDLCFPAHPFPQSELPGANWDMQSALCGYQAILVCQAIRKQAWEINEQSVNLILHWPKKIFFS